MHRTAAAITVGLVLVAGCGRGGSTAGPVGAVLPVPPTAAAATRGAAPDPAVRTAAPPAPPSVPPLAAGSAGAAAAVDLAPVEGLLSGVDRALADGQPGNEDDPSR